jgi:hypothetical protein
MSLDNSRNGEKNPVYYILGHGNGYPVTVRPMATNEKRRFRQWNKQ